MTGIEKVLYGLASCGFYDGIPNICEVTECPYRDNKAYCVHELAHDAGMLISELLKAQEPATVEPKRIELVDETKAWLDKMDAVDALGNIANICIDWDGYRTADGLGGLINEIWAYARYCADRLAKSQEPRVMTLEEVQTLRTNDVVWLEDKGKPNIIPGIVRNRHLWPHSATMVTNFMCGDGCKVTADDDDYGKRWRCWTSRPTDEQREAVKWE